MKSMLSVISLFGKEVKKMFAPRSKMKLIFQIFEVHVQNVLGMLLSSVLTEGGVGIKSPSKLRGILNCFLFMLTICIVCLGFPIC